MSRIFYLMGKSSSGKDTMYSELLKDKTLKISRIVPYTTRPVRANEKEGREYHFVTEEEFHRMLEQKEVVEYRTYQTVKGPWTYFTADDLKDMDGETDHLAIGTLESYISVRKFYGADHVFPIYLEVEDGLRLQRALDREKAQKNPDYAEMCRRFLADTEDFSEERLREAGIEKRFVNHEFSLCMDEIKEYIQREKIMI